MKLYHGTRFGNLGRILSDGLQPRNASKQKSNYKGLYASHVDKVYLTDSYAPFFSARAHNKLGSHLLFIEIETDRLVASNLRPDEDYVAQYAAAQTGQALNTLHKQVPQYIDQIADQWQVSLERLGTLGYRGIIPPAAITRYCVVDWAKHKEICLMAVTAAVAISHHAEQKRKYQTTMQWFFGDRPDIVQPYMSDIDREYWRKHYTCRCGISITNCLS